MIRENGKIYRYSKRENISHVFQESGDSFFDPNFTLIHENIGLNFMVRGEGPIVFKSNVEDKWYLLIDEYGFRGYIPLETTDLDSGIWTLPEEFSLPAKPRHGSVLSVTRSEYERLLAKYGSE